jgi:hypothetical protein
MNAVSLDDRIAYHKSIIEQLEEKLTIWRRDTAKLIAKRGALKSQD